MTTPRAFDWLAEQLAQIPQHLANAAVSSVAVSPAQIHSFLAEHFDLARQAPLEQVLELTAGMLRDWGTQGRHKSYFGSDSGNVHTPGIIAEGLAAGWNLQLSSWQHAPAAAEIEKFTLDFLMQRIGLDTERCVAHFTSSAAEANHTAVVVALTQCFPDFAAKGLGGCDGQPLLYVSEAAHPGFQKIAHAVGLGRKALRRVPCDPTGSMQIKALRRMVMDDAKEGNTPFMIVATAGTACSGALDPLKAIAAMGRVQGMWVHVDAAYGGMGVLSESLRPHLDGMRFADSIAMDGHHGLSIPVGAGMFYCRHPRPVQQAFELDPPEPGTHSGDVSDPHLNSMRWSRPAFGLKLFLTLAHLGADGYSDLIQHQLNMVGQLRTLLEGDNWRICNSTPLPVLCIQDPGLDQNQDQFLRYSRWATEILESGKAWVRAVRLTDGNSALQVWMSNYESSPENLLVLQVELERVRKKLK